ncbi:MAG TPA: lasso peptide biosynthesis B2 protein [Gemmatimonadaceae bacterium]|nr:lasso peptide biosynthesis B2 protein [Gemmatimonadaceae bacterium]
MNRWLERGGALAAVVLIPLLLAVLPLPSVLAVCDRWPRVGRGQATPNGLADRARRWLAHGRGPWTSSCLTRSLVLYAMLRQHGHRPRLHVGVEGDARAFAAHAWVTLGGHPVEQPVTVGDRYQALMVHGG